MRIRQERTQSENSLLTYMYMYTTHMNIVDENHYKMQEAYTHNTRLYEGLHVHMYVCMYVYISVPFHVSTHLPPCPPPLSTSRFSSLVGDPECPQGPRASWSAGLPSQAAEHRGNTHVVYTHTHIHTCMYSVHTQHIHVHTCMRPTST